MEICDFLKNWKRMCNSMTEMNECEDCPIVRNTYGARCCDMTCEMRDVENIVREVEKWVAEHPEPAYPTWIDWLRDVGVIPTQEEASRSMRDGVRAASFYVIAKAFSQIPADMAKRLEIKPKEDA